MSNTAFELVDLASFQHWLHDPREGNDQRLARLRRNLPLALQEELTPRQRQMVMMRYYDGKNVTAIAAELGVNKSTVSRSLRRSRELLRHSLRYSL